MPELTTSSMHDARDEEDRRLFEAGEVSLLVEGYYGVILGRCRARVWPEDQALGVAADVAIRLLSELKRGRRYRVPFRVVVHQVITWTIKGHFEPQKVREVELEDWLSEASTDSSSELDPIAAAAGFDALLQGLTELEQEVLRLHYEQDLDFQEIGRRLGKTANAVHQIHFRALEKLRREAA